MASTPQELLERCTQFLMRCVQEDAALARELAPARLEFFGGDLGDHGAQAEARFREWFLFERPSRARQESPAFSFQERLSRELPEKAREFAESLPESVFGVFEIEEDLDGVWSFQDLLNQREYAVLGPIRSREDDETTKNFVGRLFAWNEQHFVSPVSRRFLPQGELWEALREDLRKARQAHGGSRISQAALEPVIWPKRASGEAPSADMASLEAQWKTLSSGAPEFSFERVRASLQSARHQGAVVAEILDRMAFETRINLDEARVLLLQMQAAVAQPKPVSPPCCCGSGQTYEDCCRGADAVKAFEEGKARGENLDELFRKLEEDLGLDSETDEDPGEAPSEPELSLLAEEFLWEVRSEGGEELKNMLRHFEQQENPPLTHLEELNENSLRRYLAVALPMSEAGKDATKAESLLKVLARFGVWADLEQGVALAAGIERLVQEFKADLPRIARCNRSIAKSSSQVGARSMEPWAVASMPNEKGIVEIQSLRDQSARLAQLTPELAGELQRGDIVFVHFHGTKSAGSVLAAFSSHAKPFLE